MRLVSTRPDESARLRDACERLGCFRVSGHRVPAALQANMKAAVCALFDLPDDAKRRNTDTVANSSYIAPNPINPLYESLGLWDAALAADIDAFCSRLDAPPHARETVKRYVEEMHDLVVDVASKVAVSLGLDQLDQFQFQDWPCQFRMNKYNYTQDTVGCQGVQTHTDSGFLTVIQEDDCVGGLEVLDPAINEFVPVDHPLPGTFIINVGDVGKVRACSLD